jgi:hypothetical protein
VDIPCFIILYNATGVTADLGREVTSEPSTSPEDRYASGPLVDATRSIGLGGLSIPEYCHSGTACAGSSGTPKNRRPLSASDRSGPAHAASRALLATHALKTMHPGSTPHWGGLRALVVALVLQRAHARPRATCCRCAEPLALAGRLRPIFGFLDAASKIFQVEVQKTAEITCIDFCHFGGWSARACEVPLCTGGCRRRHAPRQTSNPF